MRLTRRTLLATPALLLAAPRARAASVTDAAGRSLEIPATVTRVFPAGPPAAILLYTLAPALRLGWPRGNTANLESVLALKPDLIIDVGSTAPTYVSLAERVQEQTKIPYALLDGRFDAAGSTYRLLGQLTHRDAGPLATYAEETLAKVQERVNRIPQDARPRVYYARGPKGLETGLGGSINVETLEFLGARNVAGEQKGGLAT